MARFNKNRAPARVERWVGDAAAVRRGVSGTQHYSAENRKRRLIAAEDARGQQMRKFKNKTAAENMTTLDVGPDVARPEVEPQALPDAAALERRLQALEPKKLVGKPCSYCGLNVQYLGGKTWGDRWACSYCTLPLDVNHATEADALDFGVSAVLGLGYRLVGAGAACQIQPFCESGRTSPNRVRWGHVDPSELAAKFDAVYGQRTGGPVVVLHRPVIGEHTVRGKHYLSTAPTYGKAEVVVLDPDSVPTYARGQRPLLAHEAESAARRATIAGKRAQRRVRVVRPREGRTERVAARAALLSKV